MIKIYDTKRAETNRYGTPINQLVKILFKKLFCDMFNLFK